MQSHEYRDSFLISSIDHNHCGSHPCVGAFCKTPHAPRRPFEIGFGASIVPPPAPAALPRDLAEGSPRARLQPTWSVRRPPGP